MYIVDKFWLWGKIVTRMDHGPESIVVVTRFLELLILFILIIPLLLLKIVRLLEGGARVDVVGELWT